MEKNLCLNRRKYEKCFFHKILLIMRLMAFLIFVTVGQLIAAQSYSQTTLLNLNLKGATVEEVLNRIEETSNFFFLYNKKIIDVERKVDISAENKMITEILDLLFNKSNVNYTIIDRQIVLSGNNTVPQQKDVSGKVTDPSGAPLPGVTVVVKGTTHGAITDTDGNYWLSNISNDAILVFSFVGMKTQEMPVAGKVTIDIRMEEETVGLEEVVAIGYGTMKKSDLTGAVRRVDMEEQSVLPNITLSQALSGLSAGVNIDITDDDEGQGLAGSEPSLSIRGQTSLSANDDPLIVLDGIIYNGSISDINVNDIEHVDILKDASAAAVYGSRSANGVIIITTKKGKTEKPVISFSMNYGFQDMTNTPMKVMNAEQYAVRMLDYYYQQDLYAWYKTSPTSDSGKPVRPDATDREVVASYLRTEEEKDNYLAGNEVDWVDAVTKIAPIQNYNLSFSGKRGRSNYFVSGGYTKEEGILENDQFERATLRSNLESVITNWFTLGVNIAYSYRDYSGINADLEDARKGSPLANNDIGDPNFATWLTGESYMANPLGDTYDTNEDTRNNIFLVASAKIQVPFIKGLTYDFNYSNNYYNRNNFTFYPVYVNDGSENNGKAEKKHSDERNWIYNHILTYLRTFRDHHVNATLLFSQEKRHSQSSTLTSENFDNPVLEYNNMKLGTIYSLESEAWEESSISYMARVNYQYKNRYMLTGTVRRDGFSGFGSNSKYATLPSLSVGWVASEEPFLQDLDLPYLKLRLSYGINGNQGIGRYSSLSKMSNESYVYGPAPAIAVYPESLGNADLSWEKTASFNLGIDYSFLDQRIMGSIDLYKAKTTDVLVERSIPAASGYGKVWANIGELENKGIEMELTTHNFNRKDFQWITNVTFSLNRDEITKLYGGKNDYDEGNSWFVGEPISAIYDYEFYGGGWHGRVWTEDELYSGNIYSGWYPGQYRYVDQDATDENDFSGSITSTSDRKIIGYKAPNYRFSISNTLCYKNVTLFFLFNSIQGGNGYYIMNNYDNVNVESRSDNVYRRNQSAARRYWTPTNGVTNATGIYNSPAVTGGIYEDRSFVRLQDISLTYKFSPAVLNSVWRGINDLQVFVAGKNLYTWTDWSGWDPETGTNNIPLMRNITLGVKLTF